MILTQERKIFRKLLNSDEVGSLLHKCLHRTDFLSTEHFKVKHGFLKH